MEIRNLMEDAAKAVVNELFDAEIREKRLGYCTCDQCRLDVACYVLNRLKPEYIVSSRGLAYSERESNEKIQRSADIITLVKEGWGKVSHSPRETADHNAGAGIAALPSGPAYNFPTVMGRVFDGRTFAPVAEGKVTLLESGIEVSMVDPNWQNPFVLAGATGGTYIFWPLPIASSPTAGQERTWTFEVRVEAPGFDTVSHFFELELAPERETRTDFSLQRVHKMPDLYVFPAGQIEEDD